MKKWLIALFCMNLFFAFGCGGGKKKKKDNPDDNGIPWVQGDYSCEVVETENTCSGDGPREFPDPIPAAFTQVDMGTDEDGNPIPTDEVYFNGGGVNFGGPATLTTTGAFSVTDYAVGEVMLLDYASQFETASGVATGNIGTMRIDYAEGACYDGNSGYNVLELSCEKVESESVSVPNMPIVEVDRAFVMHESEWKKRADEF